MLDKAYDAELDCTVGAAQSYGTSASTENLRAALFAKLRLALILSWTAQHEAQDDFESAHETLLEALDLSRFVFDATANDGELIGVHAAAQAVDEDIAAGVESLRLANPAFATDNADEAVDDADRVVRTQASTRAVEAFLDQWERRSRRKTFDGADVIEAVDGSTTVQVRTDRDAWLARSATARRETFGIVFQGIAGAITPGPLGYVLKFVDAQGETLIAVRVPRDLTNVTF
jgi:hypothetical protein